MNWLRALAAFVISFLFPGAGHALLREWVRALLFAGLYVSAVALFMPIDDLAAAASMAEMMTIVENEPWTTQTLISMLTLFAAVDAGFRALGGSPRSSASETPTCPNCGKELDAELEFCHWCTTRLEWPESESAASGDGNDNGDGDSRETTPEPDAKTK